MRLGLGLGSAVLALLLPLPLPLTLPLLQVKVAQRLGSFKGGADDVVGHGWFEGPRP